MRSEKRKILQLKKCMRQKGCSAWGIQFVPFGTPFAHFLSKCFELTFCIFKFGSQSRTLRVRDLGRVCNDESHDFVVICDSFPKLARWRLPECLSDLRTSFSHRHLWVIAGSIEPFPLREREGGREIREGGGRIMCRILDKLSGIPGTHTVSGILSNFAISLPKRRHKLRKITISQIIFGIS